MSRQKCPHLVDGFILGKGDEVSLCLVGPVVQGYEGDVFDHLTCYPGAMSSHPNW